jgi:Carboxypeptidase regulatory-like domain
MRLCSRLCLVILIAGLVTDVPAQTIFGTILGTVTDSTGAVAADVQIRVVDVNTNIERRTTTDELGNYEVGHLSPGQYRVETEHSGFNAWSATGSSSGHFF